MSEPSGPQEIVLEWYEFVGAVDVGLLRFAISMSGNLNHASTYQRTWIKRLEEEAIGACAERAVAKHLKRYWDGSVNTFHNVADLNGSLEVRGTARPDGCLILRENDADDRYYALVTGEAPKLMWRGYILGGDGKREEWVRDPHGYRKAWFVPQKALVAPP